MTIKDLAKYKHYKGGVYEVICEGRHTETEEELIVCKAGNGSIWIRPKKMFFERLQDGRKRFERIEEEEK